MQQNKNSEPPKVMTWGRATPFLAGAGLFDLLRLFFSLFWFFGPALAAAYCASKASDWVGSLWGLTTLACGAGAAAIGAAGVAVTAPFGIIMAMAVGFAGFLVLGFCIIKWNPEIFKASATGAFQLVASFGASEIPFIGALPVFFFTLRKLFKNQIQVEQAAYKKWETEQAEAQAAQRKQQAMQAQQVQMTEQSQFMEQQAANDDEFEQEQEEEQAEDQKRVAAEAANDDQYTPEMQKAA